jgi:hypothetical protein
MAYVVARPKGRFEIRESVHTSRGPRSRSLANFSILTSKVLETARGRSTRPFEVQAVLSAAERAGVPTAPAAGQMEPSPETRRFVDSSRRMVQSLAPRPDAVRQDPGDALIDLLGFVDQIRPFRPTLEPEPLRFPVLHRLQAQRSGPASG